MVVSNYAFPLHLTPHYTLQLITGLAQVTHTLVDVQDNTFWAFGRCYERANERCSDLLPDAHDCDVVYTQHGCLVPLGAITGQCRVFFNQEAYALHCLRFPLDPAYLCLHAWFPQQRLLKRIELGRSQHLQDRYFLGKSDALPSDHEAGVLLCDIRPEASLALTRAVYERIKEVC